MSQDQGFSDGEIADLIFRSTNLKLDKDFLIRPNRQLLHEIFSRYLDQMYPKWRGDDDHNRSQVASLIHRMGMIFKKYNIEPPFNHNDLLQPTRKRTNTFLNALILYKAEYDYIAEKKQSKFAAVNEKREKKEEMVREIADLQLKRDELACSVGQGLCIVELREREAELKSTLKASEDQCQDFDDKKEEKKTQIFNLNEVNKTIFLKTQEIYDKIDKKKKAKQLSTNISNRKDESAKGRNKLEDLNLQYEIKKTQSRITVQKRQEVVEDTKQRYRVEEAKRRESLEEVDKRMREIAVKRKERDEKIKVAIDRVRKQNEPLMNNFIDSRQKVKDGLAKVKNTNIKIQALVFGQSGNVNNTDNINNANNINNATYIKSPRK